jgi:hypothetical protein
MSARCPMLPGISRDVALGRRWSGWFRPGWRRGPLVGGRWWRVAGSRVVGAGRVAGPVAGRRMAGEWSPEWPPEWCGNGGRVGRGWPRAGCLLAVGWSGRVVAEPAALDRLADLARWSGSPAAAELVARARAPSGSRDVPRSGSRGRGHRLGHPSAAALLAGDVACRSRDAAPVGLVEGPRAGRPARRWSRSRSRSVATSPPAAAARSAPSAELGAGPHPGHAPVGLALVEGPPPRPVARAVAGDVPRPRPRSAERPRFAAAHLDAPARTTVTARGSPWPRAGRARAGRPCRSARAGRDGRDVEPLPTSSPAADLARAGRPCRCRWSHRSGPTPEPWPDAGRTTAPTTRATAATSNTPSDPAPPARP